jgi:hypothetical protein
MLLIYAGILTVTQLEMPSFFDLNGQYDANHFKLLSGVADCFGPVTVKGYL